MSTPKRNDELSKLGAMPNAAIDTSEIPEIKDFKGAVRGHFYRPTKEQITLRIDADILYLFKKSGRGYQTRINEALRQWAEEHHLFD